MLSSQYQGTLSPDDGQRETIEGSPHHLVRSSLPVIRRKTSATFIAVILASVSAKCATNRLAIDVHVGPFPNALAGFASSLAPMCFAAEWPPKS